MSKRAKLRRIIVLRNTPDWDANARLWQTEGRLDPSQFLPNPLPTGFPQDTEELILCWNKTFSENFFSVRDKIKSIAVEQFKTTGADNILSQQEYEADIENWAGNSLVYFSDDDDFASSDVFNVTEPFLQSQGIVRWPSPVLADQLINRRAEKYFFPFRFWLHHQVRLRPKKLGFLAPLINGRQSLDLAVNEPIMDYFATNNYMLNTTGLSADRIKQFSDHMEANEAIRHHPIRMHTITNQYLSIANKLPTSITMLRNMVHETDGSGLKVAFSKEIDSLAAMKFPPELQWVEPLHQALTDYFNSFLKT